MHWPLRTLVLVCAVLHGHILYTNGKRIGVVGLFQVKESVKEVCDNSKTHLSSVMAVEAVKWVLQNLYASGDAPEIELIPYKTCGLSDLTTDATIRILSGVSEDSEIHLAGIIGPEFSQEAKIMSDIITSLPDYRHLVQISYSATASLLGDRARFSNFFRVIPNDDKQVQTMVQLMLQLEWNRISLVHDDDLYALEIIQPLVELAEANGICIPTIHQLPSFGGDTNDYQTALNAILINRTPSITGLVFVGRREVGKRFIQIASTDLFSRNTPVMVLCESFQLQHDGVTDTNGDIFQASKGSYIVSPEYTQITEFQTYWKHLFLDQDLLIAENATNPWLLDMYEEQFGGCRPDGRTKCQELTESQVDEQFPEQPLYISYAIIAAYTMVSAIRNVVNETCGSFTVCQGFYNKTDATDVLEQMNGLKISLGRDFNFTVAGLRNKVISFGKNTTHEHYQVYNFQKTVTDKFAFVPIGEYNGTQLNLSKENIKDYYDSPDGTREHNWPDVRKAQCQTNYLCSGCIPDDVEDDFVFIEGDLYVVAIVPNRESDSRFGCGKLAESNLNGFGTSMAIQKAVKDSNDMKQLGDLRVGVAILNSCSNPILADWRIQNLLKFGLKLKNGTTVSIRDKILGVIASYFSSVSVAISHTLTSLRIMHIAYAATSPALSNRTIYPYFLRVSTPDNIQADVAVNVLKEMGHDYIQLIYSKDAYGEGFRDSLLRFAEMKDVCVVSRIGIDADSSAKINQVYQILRRKPYAKMVVVVLPIFLNEFLETVTGSMEPAEFSFLGAESWGVQMEPLGKANSHQLIGSITINMEIPDQYGLEDAMKDTDKEIEVRNPWKEDYLQTTMQCHYETSFNKLFPNKCPKSFRNFWEANDMKLINWGTFAYLATKTLLDGTSAIHARNCGNRAFICDGFTDDLDGLITYMKETSTVPIRGKRANVFDANGDGNTGYVIYNIQTKTSNQSQLEYVEIGRYSSDGSFNLNKDMIVYPTSERFQSTCPNEKTCAECRSTKSDLTTDSPLETRNIALGSVIGVLVLIVVVLVVIVCVMKGKIKKLETRGDGYITPRDIDTGTGDRSYSKQFNAVHVADQQF